LKKSDLKRLGKEIAAAILQGALEGDALLEALNQRELQLSDDDTDYVAREIWDIIEKLRKQ